jgi:hypothetical protein
MGDYFLSLRIWRLYATSFACIYRKAGLLYLQVGATYEQRAVIVLGYWFMDRRIKDYPYYYGYGHEF